MSTNNNKIIRLVLPPSIVALLGTLLTWIFWRFNFGVRHGISFYIVLFVLIWVPYAGGLFLRYKPDKEKDKLLWKFLSIYGWSFMILFVLLLFFTIVMFVLIILNR